MWEHKTNDVSGLPGSSGGRTSPRSSLSLVNDYIIEITSYYPSIIAVAGHFTLTKNR